MFSFIHNGQISQLGLHIVLFFTEYMCKCLSTRSEKIELILKVWKSVLNNTDFFFSGDELFH